MKQTNMRRGFTMIELIFVIVIIGILAAVAVPKMAATKDDAVANSCVHEVNQLVSEISSQYANKKDFNSWKNDYTLDDNITNIRVGVAANDGSGITNAAGTNPHGATITYNCDGEKLADIKPALNGNNYEVEVDISGAAKTSPADKKAYEALKKQFNNKDKKSYRL